MFSGNDFDKMLSMMFYLSIVGIISLLAGGIAVIIWLFNHVKVTL